MCALVREEEKKEFVFFGALFKPIISLAMICIVPVRVDACVSRFVELSCLNVRFSLSFFYLFIKIENV